MNVCAVRPSSALDVHKSMGTQVHASWADVDIHMREVGTHQSLHISLLDLL